MTTEQLNAVSPMVLALLALLSGVLVYMTAKQNIKLTDIKKQTDGLATALAEKTGEVEHARGVKETTDEALLVAAADVKQAAMIESIVAAVIAAQQIPPVPHLVKANGDAMPSTPVADAIGGLAEAIKTTGEDTNVRARDIQATVSEADTPKAP